MNFLKTKQKTFTLIILLFSFFGFSQEFSMSHNLPKDVNPEQVFTADFTVKKGNIGSFAKFQCDLPVGFRAEAGDVKGGSFTFENQRAKIVWVSVPAESSFTFAIKLTPPKNALNECVLTPKFYYLENNAKKEFETAPHHIRIGTVSTSVATSEQTKVSNNQLSATSASETTSSATETKSNSNTVENNTSEGKTSNEISSNEKSSSAQNNTVTETKPSNAISSASSDESTKNLNAINSSATSNSKTNSSSSTSNTNSTSSTTTSGLTYKVQLGAFSTRPIKSKFPGIECNVTEEDGLFKVTTGNFSSKEQAEKLRSSLISKGYPCFIVSYQNGIRVKK